MCCRKFLFPRTSLSCQTDHIHHLLGQALGPAPRLRNLLHTLFPLSLVKRHVQQRIRISYHRGHRRPDLMGKRPQQHFFSFQLRVQ